MCGVQGSQVRIKPALPKRLRQDWYTYISNGSFVRASMPAKSATRACTSNNTFGEAHAQFMCAHIGVCTCAVGLVFALVAAFNHQRDGHPRSVCEPKIVGLQDQESTIHDDRIRGALNAIDRALPELGGHGTIG